MDGSAWHGGYDTADSWTARRLRTVRQQIRRALDDAPPGPLKVISLSAGDGRDLLHVLAGHSRRHVKTRRHVWTRHRGEPDRVPLVCRRFEREGFELLWLSEPDAGYGVGAHRFAGPPRPWRPGLRLFEFVGYDVLRDRPGAAAS
ncbi:hypothetical protein ABZ613_36270 [Streptomyces collinus]|uniref:hypothetical protein n=1 Tax=Streptomyces collinus TaxID=42684 RepID=UPI0033C6029D